MEMQAVDHDPFAVPTQAVDHDPFALGFEAVDHDPFAVPDYAAQAEVARQIAAARMRQAVHPTAGRQESPGTDLPGQLIGGMAKGMVDWATLPMREPVHVPPNSYTDDSGRILVKRDGQLVPWHDADPVASRAYEEDMRARSQWAPQAALSMIGGASPFAARGAVGAAGGKLLQTAAEPATEAAQPGIRAYHGSPHDFDAFDLSKIGTGEGAQAYGHGLYFAENPSTAQSYRDSLAKITFSGAPWDRSNPEQTAAAFIHLHGGRGAAISDFEKTAGEAKYPGDVLHAQRVLDALRGGKPLPKIDNPGRMYEVNINAHPDQFLDWDKPLSEHPPEIQSKLSDFSPHMTGAQINESARLVPGEYRNNSVARENLAARGIPGIKYLDQGSRISASDTQAKIDRLDMALRTLPDWKNKMPAAQYQSEQARLEQALTDAKKNIPEATRNYVVFDPKLIDIIKKYGIAGLGAFPVGSRFLEPVDHDPFSASQ